MTFPKPGCLEAVKSARKSFAGSKKFDATAMVATGGATVGKQVAAPAEVAARAPMAVAELHQSPSFGVSRFSRDII
ncbi:hypothetical protein GGQ85_002726 [Nitrobacter vulgaris]|nr:hypothetical protein [Nitrobacter vulgaris]MDR6305010.1 hypothetical protein [Nitrobacter vulgaris]